MHDQAAYVVAVAVGIAVTPGCLPTDTRPEPGSILTTASGSEATRAGVVTADGWSLTFQKVLLGIGPIQLGDDCTKYAEYSEPGYDRIVALTAPAPQKVSIMYGLGKCDIDFQISPPTEDCVLSPGVSEIDKTFMRTPGSDNHIEDDGVTMRVEGSATLGARTLTFAWSLRQTLFFSRCGLFSDGKQEPGLDLRGGVPLTYNLRIETEGLFRDDVDRELGALRFAPFAEADARGKPDGNVDLDELDLIPISELRETAAYSGGEGHDVGTLEDYVYIVLFQTLLRFRDSGECSVWLTEQD